jgi:DNA-binding GntR family transcriptional regulator
VFDRQSPFLPKGPSHTVALAEQQIRHAIVVGGFSPGERLSEQLLCRDYRLGRGIIRAALNRLAQAGFVTSQPRSGWKVTPITAIGLREITLGRGQLEPLLGDVEMSDVDIGRLEAICDMQAAVSSHATSSGEPLSLLRGYDREIRDLLASRLKAPLIAAWLGNLWDRSDHYLNFLEATAIAKLQPADWTTFVADKKAGRNREAVRFVSRVCAAFASFAQARLLESDLAAATLHKPRSKAKTKDETFPARPVRERPPSKRPDR